MNKIKVIIFDFDGVIVDSNSAYEHVFERLAKKHNVKIKKEEILHHFGEHPKHILKEIFHGDIDKIFDEYKKIITGRNFIRKIRLMAVAKKELGKLKKKYTLALASGATKDTLFSILKKFALEEYFSVILSGDDVKEAKPNPEMINKIMKKMKISKKEILYIGDAPNDVIAAKKAKVRIAVVLTGVLKKKEAREMKADYIIKDISYIEGILEKKQ